MKALSKAQAKLIRSLEHRKYRLEHRLFVVEGDKMVRETLASSLTTVSLIATPDWIASLPPDLCTKTDSVVAVSEQELSQISFLTTAHQAMALVRTPDCVPDMTSITSGLALYLDAVQDPGNVGTIIRTADWFGIRHVLLGEGSADVYNPKTIQSTMGAVLRVQCLPVDRSFLAMLRNGHQDYPIYGAFLHGDNLYTHNLPAKALIVVGNESKGISAETAAFTTHRITIPSWPAGNSSSESLNVAMATGIICGEFRRQRGG